MHRRILISGLLLATLTLASCSSTSSVPSSSSLGASSSSALMGMLTSSLGVTPDQAAGGVGSMLKLAQEKLVKGDFDQIAAVIPGAQGYLDKAKALGAFSGNIGNLAGLNSSLGKLGISPETATKMIPAVTDFVSKAGGSDLGSKLAGALM